MSTSVFTVDIAMPVEDKSKALLPFLSSPKLLPDESEAEFQSGLQSLLSELDNPSLLGGCAGQPA